MLIQRLTMKAVVALLVSVSLAACFPNSAKHRTYAKIGEGAALAAGIAILYTVNTGAAGDETSSGCRSDAQILSGVGLGLILAGLTGFIATVSTSPDDKPEQPANTLAPMPMAPTAPAEEPAAPAETPTEAPAAPAAK